MTKIRTLSVGSLVLFIPLLLPQIGAAESKTGAAPNSCPGLLDTPAGFLGGSGGGSTTSGPVVNPQAPGGPGAGPSGAANTGGTPNSGSTGTPSVGSHFLDNLERHTGSGSANAVLTMQNAMMLSQLARGGELTQEALHKTAEFRSSENSDRGALEKEYNNISYNELNSRLKRAEGELSNLTRFLDESPPGEISPADHAFFRNNFANAADKARLAQELLQQDAKDPEKKYTREEVRELLDEAKQNQSSLLDRLLLLNGLPEQERQSLLDRLSLAEQVKIVLPDGRKRTIPLLHNGYLTSTGRSDLDCPTFVAATLSPKFRKANLTTLDLRGIWGLSRTGHLPLGVKWAKGREEVLRKVSAGFQAVDLYLGEQPAPGDLLVHRVLSETTGRVAIVRGYDPEKQVAKVAEPSADGSRLLEYDFPLSNDKEDSSFRRLRPGLANLRLLADQNSACSYESSKKASRGNQVPGRKTVRMEDKK
ncbi:MAG: hypothetical protein A2X94_04595 [Bdellovibrionales bacterium GWB1_55_8]|nr:MAG: hypothetical protein A2X94_04595 [Bdellovibrionales bacterium GWB1_55_8]